MRHTSTVLNVKITLEITLKIQYVVVAIPLLMQTSILKVVQCGVENDKLQKSGKLQGDDITMLWNCDRVPAFESNTFQIWPIQCQVIELSPKDGQRNICVPCLWFGHSKPNMFSLLTVFVDQLKTLEDKGITWRDRNNVEHISKVHSMP